MDIFLARQPIFDSDKHVVAYEILYRSGEHQNAFDGKLDGDVASATVVMDLLVDFGISNITNGKMAFINFTKNLLIQKVPELFKNDQLTVEILENIAVDQSLIDCCRELKDKGYIIALDDFTGDSQYDALLPYIDLIKVDFLILKSQGRKYVAQKYKPYGIKLLAEKVEDNIDFEEAIAYGYDFFQGFFFEKPIIVKEKTLNVTTFRAMEILKAASAGDMEFEHVSQLVEQDVSITYKLLRLVNSPAFYSNNKITSVRQALTLLGINEIKKWITLIMLREISADKPDEIVKKSLIRATFAERAASLFGITGRDEEAFILGLLSLIDTLMDKALFDILEELPLGDDLKSALLGPTNPFHELLRVLRYYEAGNWDGIIRLSGKYNIPYETLNELYFSSIIQATNRIEQM
jgi:EAL and modified HD-GYP domain-containing signal transduction protein